MYYTATVKISNNTVTTLGDSPPNRPVSSYRVEVVDMLDESDVQKITDTLVSGGGQFIGIGKKYVISRASIIDIVFKEKK